MQPPNCPQSRTSIAGTNPFQSGFAVQVGLILLLAIGLVGPVQAQERTPTQSENLAQETEPLAPTWRANFGVQAGRLLEEETNAAIRETVLRNVIRVATRWPAMDLSQAIRPLVYIVKTASDPKHRMMALQALHNIDPEQADPAFYHRAMIRVNELMESEPSEKVRRAASATLESYVS